MLSNSTFTGNSLDTQLIELKSLNSPILNLNNVIVQNTNSSSIAALIQVDDTITLNENALILSMPVVTLTISLE